MAFLLDTNVISETIRTEPEAAVLRWLEAQVPSELFLASQTIGELIRGACKLPGSAKQRRLLQWIENDLTHQFEGRIVPFDDHAARFWGRLMGDGDRAGRTPAAADAQIAAVALVRSLTLVTRNTRDFSTLGVDLVNPWEA